MTRLDIIERGTEKTNNFFRVMKNKECKSVGWDEKSLAFSLNGILQAESPRNTVLTVQDGDSVWLSASYNWWGKLTAADVVFDGNAEFFARMLRLNDGEWSANGMFSWEDGDVLVGDSVSILPFYRK